ncbi:MAG TPA: hypothetical protein VGT98_17670 [Candidatus Elarobacter sp.]|nr:hypothetical protein [Candidatus Elarobacter sp.]
MMTPLVLALTLVTTPATPSRQMPQPADYVYTFRVTESGKSEVTSGTVRVHGDRVRIDMDGKHDHGEYLLVTENGTQMLSIHPDRKEIDRISSPRFEQIIGTALRTVSPLVKFRVLDPRISWQRVETGTRVLGYATEHVRITEQYDVQIAAMGFDGGTERNVVVTDYWVSPGLDLGRNPLITLLTNASTATAQTDRGFVQREEDVRAEALQGTPLHTVVTETTTKSSGQDRTRTKTRTIDITSVKQGAQPAALFEVPSGYRMKDGANISM